MTQNNNKKPSGFKQKVDQKFQISKRNSSFKTETIAGVVNFMVLVYVMVVIPNILSGGVSTPAFWNAIYLATLLSVVFATLFMALGANLPLVSAPGIGLASYFATLVGSGAYTYSQALAIALTSGILFLFLTLIGFRKKIIFGLPETLRTAIPVGIGLFILNIGLQDSNSGILSFLTNGPTYLVNGQMVWQPVLVALVGLVVMFVLHHKKVKGAIFFGIISATLVHFGLQLGQGINPFESLATATWLPPVQDLWNETFLKFDFVGAFWGDGSRVFEIMLSSIIIVFSYTLVDLFDTVGTLFGAAKNTNLMLKNGDVVNSNRVFWVDSASSIAGSVLGVPGCTVYVESTAGISSGARTGFASLVTGLLFVLALFLAPVFTLIPASATAPALIFVGITMFHSVTELNFKDIALLVPAVFTIVLMPLTNNISYGIGVGLILYSLLMLFTKRGKQVKAITYVLSAMFLVFFLTQNIW